MKHLIKSLAKENSFRGASLILVITLAISNILGLLRDRFLAHNVSYADSDVYFAAFRIPDTIFNFLILGAITSAFIPVFSEFVTQKKDMEGNRLASSLINIAFLAMVFSAVILYFIMPTAVKLVVPQFDGDRFNQVVLLSRVMMLTPIFFSVSYVISGILNTHKRFLATSLSPLVYNISIITGAAWAAPRYGLRGVVYFVVAGSVLHLLIQIPALWHLGFSYRPIIDIKDRALIKIFRLMIPRSVSLGASQILFTVFTAVGSALAAGSISAFHYANNIQTVPLVVLGNALVSAVFPIFSHAAAKKDFEKFSKYLNRTARIIVYFLIPSTIYMILLRAQIVRLILGTGKVTWDNTRITALALACFAISLLAQGLVQLLLRAFFALRNTRTPMYSTLVMLLVGVVAAYPLARLLSVSGLALAYSIGSVVQMIYLVLALKKMHPEMLGHFSYRAISLTAILGLLSGVMVWGTMHFMANIVDMHRFWGVLVQTATALLVGSAFYLLLGYLFDCDELKWIFRWKTKRIDQEESVL